MATILRPQFLSRAAALTSASAPARRILHVDLDCFFVSVERVLDPALAQRPVIVGGDPAARGVVTSASREARASGVSAGMSSALARRLCPEAVFLPGRGRLYARAASAAQRILREFSSEVERASIDEAYLDISDAVSATHPAMDVAMAIQRALMRRLGLPSSVGIGSNKLIAKVACQRAKPEGIVEVWTSHERAFLGPLPVGDLPGVGPVLEERLRLFGLRSVSDLSRVDKSLLEATFGAMGRRLADMALGIDEAPLATSDAPQSVGREHTFAADVTNSDRLIDEIYELAGTVAARLRQQGLRGRSVSLKLRNADFQTRTRSRTLAVPTDDPGEIAGVACFLLREIHLGQPVRLVGVQVASLTDEPVQGELFTTPLPPGMQEAEEADRSAGAASEQAMSGQAVPEQRMLEAKWGGLTIRWFE